MKKLSFLALALIALTTFSCSKENDNSNPVGNAKISISFESSAISKVATEATDALDKKINDVSIFVFQESGINDVPRVFSNTVASGTPVNISATTAAKRVYVVANIGTEAEHATMFSSVFNEASLLALVKDRVLDLQGITATDVLMTGVGTVGTFTNKIANVTVNLSFPLSKIRVIVKDNRFNNLTAAEVDADGKISIEESNVILINAGKAIKFFSENSGLDQAMQSDFYTGITGPEFNQYFSNAANIAAWRAGNNNTEGDNTSTNTAVTHHFYTAANNGNSAVTPTILAIESTKTTHVAGAPVTSTVYYPIQFTIADANNNTLEPGKSYTVTLTLNGDVSAGDGGGVIDPMLPVIDGSVNVTINVATWTPVEIGKDFN